MNRFNNIEKLLYKIWREEVQSEIILVVFFFVLQGKVPKYENCIHNRAPWGENVKIICKN